MRKLFSVFCICSLNKVLVCSLWEFEKKKTILEKKCQKNSCKSGKRVNLIQKPAPHENSGVEGTVQDVRDLKAELTFRATEQT